MKHLVRYVLLIFVVLVVFSQLVSAENFSKFVIQNSMDIASLKNQNNKIDEINAIKINSLKSELQYQKEILDEEQKHLDTNIQFIQIWMGTISIILAIIGIIGWKTLKKRMESDIKKEVKEELKGDVVDLRNLIKQLESDMIELKVKTDNLTFYIKNPKEYNVANDEKLAIEEASIQSGGDENAFD